MEAPVDPERVARPGAGTQPPSRPSWRHGSARWCARRWRSWDARTRHATPSRTRSSRHGGSWRRCRPAAFDAWLTRILVNRCRRGLRTFGLTRLREVPADEVAEIDLPRTADLAGAVVDRRSLERAFDRLSIDERTILVLHHLDGRSLASIAAVLKIPEGTAKSRLFKARRSLERAIEREAER